MKRWLLAIIALVATVASAERITTFAWDNGTDWPVGTTVELCANDLCVPGLTGTQHTMTVPVQPGQLVSAQARAVAPSGYQCGDPLASCPYSDWATLAQTWPATPVNVWARHEVTEVESMAAFVSYAGNSIGTATSISCNWPSGTENNHLMLALVIARGDTITTVPIGWSLVVSAINLDANGSNAYIYNKIANNETGPYVWSFGSSIRAACSINAFSGVNTANPIDSYSSTVYIVNNTAVRSASVTTSAANQLVVNFAILSQSTQLTFTPPTGFTEHHEYGGDRCFSEVSSQTYASAGATGNIDATLSAASVTKHGIAVVLNNASGGGSASFPPDILNQNYAHILVR